MKSSCLNQFLIVFLLTIINQITLNAQTCPTQNYQLVGQAAVDNFPSNCTEITGNLSVLGLSQNGNLDGLSHLESIGGDFYIEASIAAFPGTLTDLDGLSNLQTIGGDFTILDLDVPDLDPLSNLTSIGGDFTIALSDVSGSCCGIVQLTKISGAVGGNIDLSICGGAANINANCELVLDNDGDGFTVAQGDCDDNDANEFPGQTWFLDQDGDQYGGAIVVQCTRPPNGKLLFFELAGANDCNDNDSNINPGASEFCDGIDTDCDGNADNGFPNTDGDALANCIDPDDDNDGCLDIDDEHPLIASGDYDGDGIANDCDEDDDGDNVPDAEDLEPLNEFICLDSDGDGCDDCASGTFDPSADGLDTDQDGLCNDGDPDDDNDGCLDIEDEHPLIASSDFDGDGIANDCDKDDDGDNVPDTEDLEPLNEFICLDTDGDGCDDCTSGTFDPSAEGLDTDQDGLCNDGDPDDDNDGCLDEDDDNPLVFSLDDDCDGVANDCDICDGGDDTMDNNEDGIPDCSQLLTFAEYSADWKCKTNKILIVHIDEDGVRSQKCVNENSLSSHFAHGDWIGPTTSCSQIQGLINHDNFTVNAEKSLIPKLSLEIFPNPAFTKIQVLIGGALEAGQLNIFNTLGQQLYTQKIDATDRQLIIDLSSEKFTVGEFIIQLISEQSVLSKKLIIQK